MHHFGAHREGFKTIIAPFMHSSTLCAEIIASFNNPLFDPNHSLLEEVPSDQAQHNIYPPLHSPLFTPSELPSLSSSAAETEHSQLFTMPPLTPTQNSRLLNSYPIYSIPQPISTTVTMATSYTMPMHNECAAPTFNSSRPRELSRYFEDLEQLMR